MFLKINCEKLAKEIRRELNFCLLFHYEIEELDFQSLGLPSAFCDHLLIFDFDFHSLFPEGPKNSKEVLTKENILERGFLREFFSIRRRFPMPLCTKTIYFFPGRFLSIS